MKTLVWRWTLDPCSTRILTICSKPSKAAMWRAVFPSFNKKKVVKKKNKNKIKYHNHSHSITSEQQERERKREKERKERERNWVWKKKPSSFEIGSWYQVRIVCFCFQEEELWQLLHLHSQHLQKVPLFLCLDIFLLLHPSSFCVVGKREENKEEGRGEKRREEKRREEKKRDKNGFFSGVQNEWVEKSVMKEKKILWERPKRIREGYQKNWVGTFSLYFEWG